MVVHYLAPPAESPPATPLVGFVVGRAIGNSVRRHRVARQLRHLVLDRLPRVPAGAHLVIRALAPAADRTSALLAADLDAALKRLLPRTRSRPATSAQPPAEPVGVSG
jgi:ribonuclease P protein component